MPGSPQNTINIVRNVIKQKVGNSDFFSNLEKMGSKASFFKKKRKKESLKGSRQGINLFSES